MRIDSLRYPFGIAVRYGNMNQGGHAGKFYALLRGEDTAGQAANLSIIHVLDR